MTYKVKEKDGMTLSKVKEQGVAHLGVSLLLQVSSILFLYFCKSHPILLPYFCKGHIYTFKVFWVNIFGLLVIEETSRISRLHTLHSH